MRPLERMTLRWGVAATRGNGEDVLLAAFRLRSRAEAYAALGRQGTPGPVGKTIRMVDLHAKDAAEWNGWAAK